MEQEEALEEKPIPASRMRLRSTVGERPTSRPSSRTSPLVAAST